MYIKNKLKIVLIFMVCGLYSVGTSLCYAGLTDGEKSDTDDVDNTGVSVAQERVPQDRARVRRRREKLDFCSCNIMSWGECVKLLNDIESGKISSMSVTQIAAFLASKNEDGQNILHWLANNGKHSLLRQVLVLCMSTPSYLKVALNDLDNGGCRPCDLAKDDDTRRVLTDPSTCIAMPPQRKKRRVKPSVGSAAYNYDLHRAAKSGDLETVQALLGSGTNIIKITDDKGRTALHWVAENGNLKIVQALLRKKRTGIIKIIDNEGNTALHLAAANGHLEIVQALLDQCAGVAEIKDIDGCTALHLAVENGHLEIVKALLDKNADIAKIRDDSGCTALHLAAANGHLEMVKALLDKKADIIDIMDNDRQTALILARKNLHWAVVEELFNRKPLNFNPQCDNESLLHWAAANGHSETVKKLLEKLRSEIDKNKFYVCDCLSSKVSYEGNTPFHLAAMNGHLETLKVLWKGLTEIENAGITCINKANRRNARPSAAINRLTSYFENLKKSLICSKNDRGCTPLNCAFIYNRMDVVDYLLSNFDRNITECLIKCFLYDDSIGNISMKSNGDMSKFLLKKFAGDDVIKGELKNYLVNWAAREKWDMVSIMMDLSTEMDVCDELKNTALHHAARTGNVEMVQKLIDKGANINVENIEGQTPLCLAVKCRQLEVVKKLLAQDKIEINTPDCFGISPLHWAVAGGRLDIINELLNNEKTDVNIKSNSYTPLHWAVTHKNFDAVIALLRHPNIDKSIVNHDKKTAWGLAISLGLRSIASALSDGVSLVPSPTCCQDDQVDFPLPNFWDDPRNDDDYPGTLFSKY